MSATNFNTKNDTFRRLRGNGLTYRIPRFQRDYSWWEDEWEDLWFVLWTVLDGGGNFCSVKGFSLEPQAPKGACGSRW